MALFYNLCPVSSKLATILKVKIGDYETKKEGGKTDRHEIEFRFPVHDV